MWKAPSEIDLEEILNSESIRGWLGTLASLLPFRFAIRHEGKTLFSSNGSVPAGKGIPIGLEKGIHFHLVVNATNGGVSEESKKALARLLQIVLKERIRLEHELNSLSAELLEKYEELNLLYDLSQTLGAQFNLGRVFEIILRRVEELLDVQRISIMLYDEEREELEIAAARGFDPSKLDRTRISIFEGISGYVLRTGKPLLVESLENLPGEVKWKRRPGYTTDSFISVPMVCSPEGEKDIKIGVINVTEKRTGEPFRSGDLKLLQTIASNAAIAIYNSKLIDKVKESERLQKELEIAEQIQKRLLPSSYPVLPDLELAGACRPARKVGGDYFDYFLDQERRLNLVIADVSGHNVGAALMMAVTRSVLRSILRESIPAARVLEQANALLFEDLNRSGYFISIFFARFDRREKTLTFANGGHHPLFLYRARTREVEALDADGLLLGIMPRVLFEEKTVALESGDVLVMYTDGIIEAMREDRQLFSHERLKQVIRENAQKGAGQIVDAILEAVDRFSGKKVHDDDITLQILKVH